VPLILVDHRLTGTDVPTVDLRGIGANGQSGGTAQNGGDLFTPNKKNPQELPGYDEAEEPSGE
jgi:hypothetical protein